LAVSVIPHAREQSLPMNNYLSVAKFTAFVQLKDYRDPTKNEPFSYIRQRSDQY
jgi:hypothetical protein